MGETLVKELLPTESSVLIVDDEEDLLEIIVDTISPSFKATYKASDGNQATQILSTTPIHAIVTDYHMPKMSGLELVDYVQKNHPEIPIIMLTGNADNPEVIDAIKRGAFDIISKPFRSEILINRIQNALVISNLTQIAWKLMSKDWGNPQIADFYRLPYRGKLQTLKAISEKLASKKEAP